MLIGNVRLGARKRAQKLKIGDAEVEFWCTQRGCIEREFWYKKQRSGFLRKGLGVKKESINRS